MKQTKKIVMGMIIGGGMVLPGVSGAVIMVIFGLYDKVIKSLSNFFKDIKNNSMFLLPIIIGVIIGAFIFGNILYFLFENHEVTTKWAFIGLILGGCPILFQKIKTEGNKKIYWSAFFSSFLLAFFLFVIAMRLFDINFSSYLNDNLLGYIFLFIAGFLFISGKIIPGISSSLLLLLIGMYEYVLNIIANFINLGLSDYILLIPFGLGIIVGAVLLVKLIASLLERHFNVTYSVIVGFIIGSIPGLYPGISFDLNGLWLILIAIIGYVFAYYFSHRFS
jgi:putative membrane protein